MNEAERFHYSFGAQVIGPEWTQFSLWAPSASRVDLEVEGLAPIAMTHAGEGRFVGEAPCDHGARYRYRVHVDGAAQGIAIADPASRAQAGGVEGPSMVVDPYHHAWRHADWRGRPWHETVLYELHLGALGGLAGARQQLPYLAELGVTAVELMPVAAFPGARNWGYDGVLPYAVDETYGDPGALKAFIDDAHGLGLMVFLDVVYNHFGPDGNHLPRYAGAFFRDDRQTPWGPAIDFRQPMVRRFFIENALMWLDEYRFDGLRFDAVHAIGERDFLRELAETLRSRIDPRRHVHLVLENEHNDAGLLGPGLFTAQWNDDWHNVMHVLLTGESEGYYGDFAEAPTQKLARCLGEGFVYQGDATRQGTPRGTPSAHLPPTAFVAFLQNHDQIGNRALGERLTRLAEPQALAAATLTLLLSPMVPLLFMGEEWASERPFLFFTDHRDELAEAVREGRRAEFAAFSAFQDPASRAAIPDPNDMATYEASKPDIEVRDASPHAEWRAFVRCLLAIRQAEIVPRLDGARALGAEALAEGAVVARWQMNDDTRLVIAMNLGERTAATRAFGVGRCLFETREGVAVATESGSLPPRCAAAWLKHVPGDEELCA
ncbi:malto-oligosyltrehalose trehalohydrolase [Billgrantia sulfidoxydans]|uniref:Malto-oligosyltrehalose trehalohydrolase n=1 Tax=Billgrantia sulfidoxydans TaxID=2733484 RepID=A0ABX7W6Q8_9GAMM|nr:malto-oligosyltrehalose trehalohydrolase [Halomonas sulfidoxydans]QTP55999.1 malto-oligosyltrehalose trehalohydrolase [Halomonas sulfidoxydans]